MICAKVLMSNIYTIFTDLYCCKKSYYTYFNLLHLVFITVNVFFVDFSPRNLESLNQWICWKCYLATFTWICIRFMYLFIYFKGSLMQVNRLYWQRCHTPHLRLPATPVSIELQMNSLFLGTNLSKQAIRANIDLLLLLFSFMTTRMHESLCDLFTDSSSR